MMSTGMGNGYLLLELGIYYFYSNGAFILNI